MVYTTMTNKETQIVALYILLTRGKYMDFTCEAYLTHDQALSILCVAASNYNIDVEKLVDSVRLII